MVPSSAHAGQNGSQWSLCKLGSPSFSGFSEKVTAWQPLSAMRRTSAAIAPGPRSAATRQRDEAAGVGAAPVVDVPVVVGLQEREGDVLVVGRGENSWPAEAGNDGKHSEPSTPLTFMSRMRSWMS